jgi:hypothetical protein
MRYSNIEARGVDLDLSLIGTEHPAVQRNEHGEYPVKHIFVSAPRGFDELQTFNWHLTTRNFVAFCLGKPVIGYSLSTALKSLHRRVLQWLPNREETDLRKYLEVAGYRNFTHSPDHALGVLRYAEHFRIEDLYATAFAHCAGMAGVLSHSLEYKVNGLPRMTLFSELTSCRECLSYRRLRLLKPHADSVPR